MLHAIEVIHVPDDLLGDDITGDIRIVSRDRDRVVHEYLPALRNIYKNRPLMDSCDGCCNGQCEFQLISLDRLAFSCFLDTLYHESIANGFVNTTLAPNQYEYLVQTDGKEFFQANGARSPIRTRPGTVMDIIAKAIRESYA